MVSDDGRLTPQEAERNRLARDACRQHFFTRVQRQPPKWRCLHCQGLAGTVYLRAFERGLIAAGAEPQNFIADYGAWP